MMSQLRMVSSGRVGHCLARLGFERSTASAGETLSGLLILTGGARRQHIGEIGIRARYRSYSTYHRLESTRTLPAGNFVVEPGEVRQFRFWHPVATNSPLPAVLTIDACFSRTLTSRRIPGVRLRLQPPAEVVSIVEALSEVSGLAIGAWAGSAAEHGLRAELLPRDGMPAALRLIVLHLYEERSAFAGSVNVEPAGDPRSATRRALLGVPSRSFPIRIEKGRCDRARGQFERILSRLSPAADATARLPIPDAPPPRDSRSLPMPARTAVRATEALPVASAGPAGEAPS